VCTNFAYYDFRSSAMHEMLCANSAYSIDFKSQSDELPPRRWLEAARHGLGKPDIDPCRLPLRMRI
jgi:hypothetical protein